MYDRRDHLHLWAPVPYIIFIQACFYFVRARRRARHKTGDGGSKQQSKCECAGCAAVEFAITLNVEFRRRSNRREIIHVEVAGLK